MLREFSKVEQRHDAVLAVIREGMRVSDVAEKFGGIETRCTPGWPLTRPKPSRASGTDRGGPRPHRLRPPLLLQAALPIGRRLRRRLGRAVGAWRSLVATRRDPVRTPPTWLPRFRRHHLAQQIRVDGKVARNGQPGDQLPIRGVIQFLRETSGLCRPHTNSIRSVVDLATHRLSSSTLLPLDHSLPASRGSFATRLQLDGNLDKKVDESAQDFRNQPDAEPTQAPPYRVETRHSPVPRPVSL